MNEDDGSRRAGKSSTAGQVGQNQNAILRGTETQSSHMGELNEHEGEAHVAPGGVGAVPAMLHPALSAPSPHPYAGPQLQAYGSVPPTSPVAYSSAPGMQTSANLPSPVTPSPTIPPGYYHQYYPRTPVPSPSTPLYPSPNIYGFAMPYTAGQSPWTLPQAVQARPEEQVSETTTPTSAWLLAAQEAALKGVFDGISIPIGPPHARRAWHNPLSSGERAVLVLNFLKNCGFDSLGHFLTVAFGTHATPPLVLSRHVVSFLENQGRPGTRPVDVVRQWYNHSNAEKYDATGQPIRPSLHSLPRHARPRKDRVQLDLPMSPRASTSLRADILDWALSDVILQTVDKEMARLCESDELSLPNPSSLTWKSLLNWTPANAENIISSEAPVLFSVVSTACTSKRTRKKLDAAVQQQPSAEEAETEPEVDDDEDDDEDDDDDDDEEPSDDRIVLRVKRDPWLVATILILTALHVAYQFGTYFPTLLSIIFFVAGVPSRAFRISGRLGFTLSYANTIKRLRLLADDASRQIHRLGRATEDSTPDYLILWDNVNKNKRAWQITLGTQTNMQSGTAATLVKLEDVPDGALRLQPLLDNIRKQERRGLTVQRLRDDIDWKHVRGVGIGKILRVWLRYIPELTGHRADVEKIFEVTHCKHKLRLRKSEVVSLRCSGIDESTTTGTWQLLMDIVQEQLRVSLDWLKNAIVFCCGDQLTIHRLRKVKLFRAKPGDSPGERAEPFLPIIQPWHTKFADQKLIFRMGFKENVAGKKVFGMHHDAGLLGRESVRREEFYPRHAFLSDRFDALILEALRLVCEESSGVEQPADMSLLDAVREYFHSGGPLASSTYDTLYNLASIVYDRYMTNQAHDDAKYASTWDSESNPTKYGPKVDAEATEDTPSDPDWSGDAVLRNETSFLRSTSRYLEFCDAIAVGDPGRVFEVMKIMRFTFWGAGSTNYGNELLELACNFMFEYPPDLCQAILNNFLVNPSGRPGHWHELDLLQEHYNYWLKRLFNTKSLDFDSVFLREVVGLNLSGFCDMRDRMFEIFGLRGPGKSHTDTENHADINRLGDHYRREGVLKFHVGREQPYHVENEYSLGLEKLRDGQLKTFLERTAADRSSVNDEILGADGEIPSLPDSARDGEPDDIDNPSIPTNPIIADSGGTLYMRPFIHNPDAAGLVG